jgi:hypothetical protein
VRYGEELQVIEGAGGNRSVAEQYHVGSYACLLRPGHEGLEMPAPHLQHEYERQGSWVRRGVGGCLCRKQGL